MFSKLATTISNILGTPYAFIIAFMIVIIWAIIGPFVNYSETWQLMINTGTTIVTFLFLFLLQHSQNKDTKAIQAKLDELIKSIDKANDELIGIEKE